MTLADLLHPGAIVPELHGTDVAEVFAELCAPLARAEGIAAHELVAALLEREAVASTALGDGLAIPHGVHPGLTRVVASLGRSRTGVALESLDGRPVHLFVALLRPPDAPELHLEALACFSRVLGAASVREALVGAASAEAIAAILYPAKS
jgi:mannitol/fructose-specific phosphotransferase system IIA component (Ntr-type)